MFVFALKVPFICLSDNTLIVICCNMNTERILQLNAIIHEAKN